MTLKQSGQVWHVRRRVLLPMLGVSFVCICLRGFFPLAFLKTGGIQVCSLTQKQLVRPAPAELFSEQPRHLEKKEGQVSERPVELKVLYEPMRMDLSVVRALEERTSTRILLSFMDDWEAQDVRMLVVLSISGSKSNVLEALLQLSTNQRPQSSITIIAPPYFGSALRYSKIEKISKIEKRTSARIFVRILPGCESKISIRGTSKAINAVADWLLVACENKVHDVRNELSAMYDSKMSFGTEIYVTLTEEQARQIIGDGEATMKRIKQEWMVDVSVDIRKRAMKLSGKVRNVHAAHQYIMEAFVMSEHQE